MDKMFKLTPDQFEIDKDGRLMIDTDEIGDALKGQPSDASAPPEAAIEIAIK